MDIRKVQTTGGSSYIITLPKDWAKDQRIGKNTQVGLITQPDGTLLIVPKVTDGAVLDKKVITIDDETGSEYLFRLLVGAYKSGYALIEMRSGSRIPANLRETVMKFISIVVGFETMEESDKSIVIKDLLSPAEMPFDKTLRRSYMLVKAMHEDALIALLEDDLGMTRDVVQGDVKVDRLQWLIARQYNIVSREANIARKMDITRDEAQFYFLAEKIIESVGDQAVVFADKAAVLIENRTAGTKETIAVTSKFALEIFKKSVDSWFQKDIKLANGAIELLADLVKKCEKIKDISAKKGHTEALALSYIAESIRMVGEYSANISELVIDQLIKRA